MKNIFMATFLILILFLVSCAAPNPSVEMVFVEGGTYMMGSEDGPDAERPVHEVKIDSFFMSKYEVNQELWFEITEEKPARYQGTNITPNADEKKLPVEMVNWYEAIEFCNKLSKRDGLKPVYKINDKERDPGNKHSLDRIKWIVEADWTATGYRLPTEAEWEYAARGGKFSKGYEYSGGNMEDLPEISCYDKNSDAYTFEVGSKKPNELGIHDMTGNVFEWCWDKFDKTYYSGSPSDNPKGPDLKEYKYRIIRGGGWGTIEQGRVAFRSRSRTVSPGMRYDWIGIRLVRKFDQALEDKIAKSKK